MNAQIGTAVQRNDAVAKILPSGQQQLLSHIDLIGIKSGGVQQLVAYTIAGRPHQSVVMPVDQHASVMGRSKHESDGAFG